MAVPYAEIAFGGGVSRCPPVQPTCLPRDTQAELGLSVNCSPAVGTNAAIAMKRASARSPGSSEMMKATAVPAWA
jgi:hypothetical protein